LEEVLAYIRASQVPPEFEAFIQDNLEEKIVANRKVSSELSDKLYEGIRSTIFQADQKSKTRRMPFYRKRLSIAATVSILLLSGLMYYYLPKLYSPTQVYTTAYGEKEQILLPDGSSVVLNANSKLRLSSDWDLNKAGSEAIVREVWLEGEAFFEIKKLSKPTRFLVHTDHLKVEVLGTRFDVNTRAQKTRVVLDEGKVKLLAHNQSELVMNPGELVELNQGDTQFQKKIVNPEAYISWRHDELIFEAVPLTEIVDILKHNYGFEIDVQEKAVRQEMLFTGKAPADDISLLLRMLSETFNINIVQTEKKIVFE
jgi:ferric-dicitrate binding protein FerR (iron transport regulator)